MSYVIDAGEPAAGSQTSFRSGEEDAMLLSIRREALTKLKSFPELSWEQRNRILRLTCALIEGSLEGLEQSVRDYDYNPVALVIDSQQLGRIIPGKVVAVREAIVMRTSQDDEGDELAAMLVIEHIPAKRVLIVSTCPDMPATVARVKETAGQANLCFDAEEDPVELLGVISAFLRTRDWSLGTSLLPPRAVTITDLGLRMHAPVG